MKDINGKEVAAYILGAILALLIYGFLVTWIWNMVIPELFVGMNTITYWQSVGLIALCRFLFHKSSLE